MRCLIRDRFPIADPKTFWSRVFFEPKIQERIYTDGLGCTSAEVVEQTGDLDSGIARRFVFAQPVEAPAPVKKIFGADQVLRERGRFDPTDGRYRFTMTTAVMADRLSIRGTTWVEAVGGEIERCCELDCEMRMMGVGGLVERYIVRSNTENYALRTRYVRGLIGELGLS